MKPSLLALLAIVALAACGETGPTPTTPASESPSRPADHIAVDHILIGVRNQKFPQGKRSESEARAYAYDLLAKLKGGADWAATKAANSEDPPPGGPYSIANRGVELTSPDEMPRDRMVAAFGDVGFSLGVGEIAVADFNTRTSYFGFHIIKRVR